MSTVFRGTAEAEAARRALERRLADEPTLPAPPRLTATQLRGVCHELGEDVIGPFLRDRRGYVATHLRPLRDRPEPLYVQSGTRAERVAVRNPAKQVRYIDYKVGLANVDNTLRGLQHMFDGTRADLDGATILCIVDDDAATHEVLLAVQNGSLRVLEPGAEPAEPTATASGSLSAWMDLRSRPARHSACWWPAARRLRWTAHLTAL
ncbi:MAG: hypothetical protein ACRD0V_02245 [Acidimicrobiales bacterium]